MLGARWNLGVISPSSSLSWIRKGKCVGNPNKYFTVTQRNWGPDGLGPKLSCLLIQSPSCHPHCLLGFVTVMVASEYFPDRDVIKMGEAKELEGWWSWGQVPGTFWNQSHIANRICLDCGVWKSILNKPEGRCCIFGHHSEAARCQRLLLLPRESATPHGDRGGQKGLLADPLACSSCSHRAAA